MARKRMVTRTISTTYASIKVFDNSLNEIYNISVQYAGEFTENEVFRKARADEENETIKVIGVDSCKVECSRYGMDEGMFIELAQKLESKEDSETEQQED